MRCGCLDEKTVSELLLHGYFDLYFAKKAAHSLSSNGGPAQFFTKSIVWFITGFATGKFLWQWPPRTGTELYKYYGTNYSCSVDFAFVRTAWNFSVVALLAVVCWLFEF